mmetsp:Transcript_23822/g.47525  ORF Transcript_23822/g.47525 Transcript_23822/m.47525 type:complete len:296 (-) Transcript_23822:372-1259(-)
MYEAWATLTISMVTIRLAGIRELSKMMYVQKVRNPNAGPLAEQARYEWPGQLAEAHIPASTAETIAMHSCTMKMAKMALFTMASRADCLLPPDRLLSMTLDSCPVYTTIPTAHLVLRSLELRSSSCCSEAAAWPPFMFSAPSKLYKSPLGPTHLSSPSAKAPDSSRAMPVVHLGLERRFRLVSPSKSMVSMNADPSSALEVSRHTSAGIQSRSYSLIRSPTHTSFHITSANSPVEGLRTSHVLLLSSSSALYRARSSMPSRMREMLSTNTTGITAAIGMRGEMAGMQHKTAMKSK